MNNSTDEVDYLIRNYTKFDCNLEKQKLELRKQNLFTLHTTRNPNKNKEVQINSREINGLLRTFKIQNKSKELRSQRTKQLLNNDSSIVYNEPRSRRDTFDQIYNDSIDFYAKEELTIDPNDHNFQKYLLKYQKEKLRNLELQKQPTKFVQHVEEDFNKKPVFSAFMKKCVNLLSVKLDIKDVSSFQKQPQKRYQSTSPTRDITNKNIQILTPDTNKIKTISPNKMSLFQNTKNQQNNNILQQKSPEKKQLNSNNSPLQLAANMSLFQKKPTSPKNTEPQKIQQNTNINTFQLGNTSLFSKKPKSPLQLPKLDKQN